MAKRRRRMFTAAESAEVWDRWQRGDGLSLIGRVIGRPASVIFEHMRRHGGIRPAPRRRSRRALSLAEREEISRGVAVGLSLRSIASSLGRAASTISRELKRNGGQRRYRAAAADKRAWDRALRPKACKLATHDQLRQLVAAKLEDNWSPEQIAGWLKHTYPDDEAYRVSHETIYRSLFVQARGVLKKDLQAHLRSGRAIRRSRHASNKKDHRGSLTDIISIRERPASVEDRAVPGHWEGDLLCGSSNSYIVTLVERHSRYVLLAQVANRDSQSVIAALIKGAPFTGRARQVADMGPRQGDGAAQKVHAGDRCRRLLLRSAVTVAARLEREHQRPAAAVLPEGHQPQRPLAGALGRGRAAA